MESAQDSAGMNVVMRRDFQSGTFYQPQTQPIMSILHELASDVFSLLLGGAIGFAWYMGTRAMFSKPKKTVNSYFVSILLTELIEFDTSSHKITSKKKMYTYNMDIDVTYMDAGTIYREIRRVCLDRTPDLDWSHSDISIHLVKSQLI